MSIAFHSSLNQQLSNKLEAIQKTCLRVILGVMYVSYSSALEMSGLKSLHDRREQRSVQLAIKCARHPTNKDMFPPNPSQDKHDIRNREQYKVNKAHSVSYNKSTIPYLQRRLNTHMQKLAEVNRRKENRRDRGRRRC